MYRFIGSHIRFGCAQHMRFCLCVWELNGIALLIVSWLWILFLHAQHSFTMLQSDNDIFYTLSVCVSLSLFFPINQESFFFVVVVINIFIDMHYRGNANDPYNHQTTNTSIDVISFCFSICLCRCITTTRTTIRRRITIQHRQPSRCRNNAEREDEISFTCDIADESNRVFTHTFARS